MGSEASEQMMALLQELAMLKELEKEYEANPTKSAREQHRLSRQRHDEIAREIKALGKEQEDAPSEAG
jgi:hypothetical protein